MFLRSGFMMIVDFKNEYPDKYIDVIAKMEEFQKKLIDRAL